MDNLTLDKLLSSHPPTSSVYLGAFPSDKLPSSTPRVFAAIVNTSPSRVSDTGHWIALYGRGSRLVYFDSFGSPPPRRGPIAAFCKRFRTVLYNRVSHQNSSENTCGGYCIYVLHRLCSGASFRVVINKFLNIAHDDAFIRDFVLSRFGETFHY